MIDVDWQGAAPEPDPPRPPTLAELVDGIDYTRAAVDRLATEYTDAHARAAVAARPVPRRPTGARRRLGAVPATSNPGGVRSRTTMTLRYCWCCVRWFVRPVHDCNAWVRPVPRRRWL